MLLEMAISGLFCLTFYLNRRRNSKVDYREKVELLSAEYDCIERDFKTLHKDVDLLLERREKLDERYKNFLARKDIIEKGIQKEYEFQRATGKGDFAK